MKPFGSNRFGATGGTSMSLSQMQRQAKAEPTPIPVSTPPEKQYTSEEMLDVGRKMYDASAPPPPPSDLMENLETLGIKPPTNSSESMGGWAVKAIEDRLRSDTAMRDSMIGGAAAAKSASPFETMRRSDLFGTQQQADLPDQNTNDSPRRYPAESIDTIKTIDNAFVAGSTTDLNEETRVKKAINGILNKLTPEKYETLSKQLLADDLKVLEVESYMRAAIELIFSRAMTQANFSMMYAELAQKISTASKERDEKFQFRRMLLDVVQAEFEKMACGDEKPPPEEVEARKKRRMGNIQFVGELYNKHLLSDNVILVRVCNMLLTGGKTDASHKADPEDLEVLCRLLCTSGKELETRTSYGKDAVSMTKMLKDLYRKLEVLSQDSSYKTRIKITLVNTLDLKKQGWVCCCCCCRSQLSLITSA